MIIERTAGRVIISHAFCLGIGDHGSVDAMIDALADAGVAIMTTAPADPAPDRDRPARAGVGGRCLVGRYP